MVDTTALIRVAAVLAVVQGAAHGALFVTAKPRSQAETAFLETMKSNSFFAQGTRSYWDLYFGYGIIAAGACIVEGLLLWQLAGIAASLATVIVTLIVANIVHALIVGRYFKFPVPIVFDLLVAGVLIAALV